MIVRANGTISPIKAYSWVSGFEIAPNKMTGFYAYYSGLYGEKNQAIDTTGSYIGWGYSGASNGADRYVQEFTTPLLPYDLEARKPRFCSAWPPVLLPVFASLGRWYRSERRARQHVFRAGEIQLAVRRGTNSGV